MSTKAGGLTRSCAPRQDVMTWSTSVATRCTREFPERRAYARRRGHPSRQDGRRLTRGNQGKPNEGARWVAKDCKTHARPELYASTPPLKALNVVLSEVALGECGGKVVALVKVRRAYFFAPAPRRVFVELPAEDCQAGDEHMCVLLQHSLYGTQDAAQNW